MDCSLDEYIAKKPEFQNAAKNYMMKYNRKDKEKMQVQSMQYVYEDFDYDDEQSDDDDSKKDKRHLWKGPTSKISFLPLKRNDEEAEFNEMYEELNRELKTDNRFPEIRNSENQCTKQSIQPIRYDLRQTLDEKRNDESISFNSIIDSQQWRLKEPNVVVQRSDGMPFLVPNTIVENANKNNQRNQNNHRIQKNQRNKNRGGGQNFRNQNTPYKNNNKNNNNRNNNIRNYQNNGNNFQNKNTPSILDIKLPNNGCCMTCGKADELSNNNFTGFNGMIAKINNGNCLNPCDNNEFEISYMGANGNNCAHFSNCNCMHNCQNAGRFAAMDNNANFNQNNFVRNANNNPNNFVRNNFNGMGGGNGCMNWNQSNNYMGNQNQIQGNGNRNSIESKTFELLCGNTPENLDALPMVLWQQLMQNGLIVKFAK